MGLYISDMEMPKGGEMIVVFSDGTVHKCLPGVREALEKGKAVPVPPHGDLIDRDKIRYVMLDKVLVTSDKAIDALPAVIPADPEEEEINDGAAL